MTTTPPTTATMRTTTPWPTTTRTTTSEEDEDEDEDVDDHNIDDIVAVESEKSADEPECAESKLTDADSTVESDDDWSLTPTSSSISSSSQSPPSAIYPLLPGHDQDMLDSLTVPQYVELLSNMMQRSGVEMQSFHFNTLLQHFSR